MSLKEFIDDYHSQYGFRVQLLSDRCAGDINRFMTGKLNDFELRIIYDNKEDIRKHLPYIGILTLTPPPTNT